MLHRIRKLVPLTLSILVGSLLLTSFDAEAFEDPTGAKPFFPWLWEDQYRPTLDRAFRPGGLVILGTGTAATLAVRPKDQEIYEHNRRGENLIMDHKAAEAMGVAGSGALGVGLALAQLYFDQENGLMHLRAITLTTLSHVTLAFGFQRARPGDRDDFLPFRSSFPSGHTSSAFASAGALAYAYGWKAGVPAFALATAIGLGRVSENAHWGSDVVAGAALGLFWARASAMHTQEVGSTQPISEWNRVMPIPTADGGLLLGYSTDF